MAPPKNSSYKRGGNFAQRGGFNKRPNNGRGGLGGGSGGGYDQQQYNGGGNGQWDQQQQQQQYSQEEYAQQFDYNNGPQGQYDYNNGAPQHYDYSQQPSSGPHDQQQQQQQQQFYDASDPSRMSPAANGAPLQGSPPGDPMLPPHNGMAMGGMSQGSPVTAQTPLHSGAGSMMGPNMEGPPPEMGAMGSPMGAPVGTPMGVPMGGMGETVSKLVYDELSRKYTTLRGHYTDLERKYLKSKDMYKQAKNNHAAETKKLHEKLKKLGGGRVENASLPDESKNQTSDNSEEHMDTEIEVQNPKYPNKEHVNVKDASVAVIKSERDVYKKNAMDLNKKLDESRRERSDAISKTIDLTKQLTQIKDSLEKIQREKVSLEEKIKNLEEKAAKSAVGSPFNSDGEADPISELNSMFVRKEHYKAKYQLLLEKQNAEQSNFLLVNKKLLEQYVFNT